MNKRIQGQLMLETTKLNKIEKKAHLLLTQANPSLDSLDEIHPHIKRLLDTTKEKA